MNTGATKLQIYSAMHTQLDTTRIHIATSDLPIYTSSSGLPVTALTTFLQPRTSEKRSATQLIYTPVGQQHRNIHRTKYEDDMEPRILFDGQPMESKRYPWFTNVVSGSGPLVISTLPDDLILVVIILFIQNRCGECTVAEMNEDQMRRFSYSYPASTAASKA